MQEWPRESDLRVANAWPPVSLGLGSIYGQMGAWVRTQNGERIGYETRKFIFQRGEKFKVFDPFHVHVIFTLITPRYDLLTWPPNFWRRRLHAYQLLSSFNDSKVSDEKRLLTLGGMLNVSNESKLRIYSLILSLCAFSSNFVRLVCLLAFHVPDMNLAWATRDCIARLLALGRAGADVESSHLSIMRARFRKSTN